MEAPEAGTVTEELRVLGEQLNMPVTQENGQRCLGPPRDWQGPPPPKGCEVFVGKLPRDIYESDLLPLFSQIGPMYEMRLMMDFSGSNRGYCFVQYTTREDAQTAIRDLNDYEIRKGRKIGVLRSVDNCRLFIGGLPKHKTESEIFTEINRVTEGVKKVIAYPSAQDKAKNRGFAFVEYNCHKTAAMARRKMIPGKILMWGQEVCVDWAEPEPEVDPAIMNKVQNLYVRNLMLNTTEETLNSLFNEHSNGGVEKVKKIKDYAFIHFSSREKADAARLALDKTEIDGSRIEIDWAKPVEKGMNNNRPRGGKQRSRDIRSSPSRSSSEARSRVSSREQSYANSGSPQYGNYQSLIVPTSNVAPQQYMLYNYMPNVVQFPGLSPKHPTSLSSVQHLAQICYTYGFGEPYYIPMSVRDGNHGNVISYNCLVQVSLHPAGFKAYRNDVFFHSAEDAKNAAADGMIRLLQLELPPLPPSVPMQLYYHSSMPPTPFAN